MNKKELMRNIILSLGQNWYKTGIDEDGKAFAWTNSEKAADALTEILYDIGCIESYDEHPTIPVYYKYVIVTNNHWRAVFREV